MFTQDGCMVLATFFAGYNNGWRVDWILVGVSLSSPVDFGVVLSGMILARCMAAELCMARKKTMQVRRGGHDLPVLGQKFGLESWVQNGLKYGIKCGLLLGLTLGFLWACKMGSNELGPQKTIIK